MDGEGNFSGNFSVDSMLQGTYISMKIVLDLLGMQLHRFQVIQDHIQLGAGQELPSMTRK
jgi:hypothetical protein